MRRERSAARPVRRLVVVADDLERPAGRLEGEEQGDDAGAGGDVAAPAGAGGGRSQAGPLGRRARSGAGVGRRVESGDKPGLAAHGGGDTAGEVLGELEGLEVVEDDRLAEPTREVPQGARQQEEGVMSGAGAQAGDGGGGATEGAGDLAVGGAIGPGAEAGSELLQSLDRGAWPVHAVGRIEARARAAPFGKSFVRRQLGLSPDLTGRALRPPANPPVRELTPQARHHHVLTPQGCRQGTGSSRLGGKASTGARVGCGGGRCSVVANEVRRFSTLWRISRNYLDFRKNRRK